MESDYENKEQSVLFCIVYICYTFINNIKAHLNGTFKNEDKIFKI